MDMISPSIAALTPSLNWLNQHPLISTAYFALSSGLALLAAFASVAFVKYGGGFGRQRASGQGESE